MKPLEGKYVVCADEGDDLLPVEEILEHLGCRVHSVKTAMQLWEALASGPVDLVVMCVCRSCAHTLEFIPSKERAKEFPPFLVVACSQDVDLYLDAMSRGAVDCVAQPVEERELARIVTRVLLETERRRIGSAVATVGR